MAVASDARFTKSSGPCLTFYHCRCTMDIMADPRLVSTAIHVTPAIALSSLTQEHVEAIGVLKGGDDRDIFAWLDLARSLEPRLQHCSDHARLTRDHVHAIAALRLCKNSDISAWLHLARTPSR